MLFPHQENDFGRFCVCHVEISGCCLNETSARTQIFTNAYYKNLGLSCQCFLRLTGCALRFNDTQVSVLCHIFLCLWGGVVA
ncbi:hypothetical protein GCWU000324_02675 [Kingella oralis ATCC 51147]|uniref:Uncharacterized protein n=1 Tax=Kingella oralis ATCC 51147 TaxID=629741 RepID=C4GLV1_9NEIS|nr:hypothetical protein GCWU000324_02675 [Kingella oralis ATCC 51147]